VEGLKALIYLFLKATDDDGFLSNAMRPNTSRIARAGALFSLAGEFAEIEEAYNSAMKKKRKRNGHAEFPAAQVAKLAQVSISRVYRLRQEGRSDAEIIRSARQRQEMLALRSLPVTEIGGANGHAPFGPVSYAASLAEKEKWAAELRRIQVMEKRRELMPVAYFRYWGINFLTEAKDLWLRGPSELRDQLASESDPLACEAIVQGFCERVVDRLAKLERLWSPPGPDAT
jgi:hypothetical protein